MHLHCHRIAYGITLFLKGKGIHTAWSWPFPSCPTGCIIFLAKCIPSQRDFGMIQSDDSIRCADPISIKLAMRWALATQRTLYVALLNFAVIWQNKDGVCNTTKCHWNCSSTFMIYITKVNPRSDGGREAVHNDSLNEVYMLRELYDHIMTLTVCVIAISDQGLWQLMTMTTTMMMTPTAMTMVMTHYSGDQHAPKVGGLLDSIILSTGHTKVLLDTWAA